MKVAVTLFLVVLAVLANDVRGDAACAKCTKAKVQEVEKTYEKCICQNAAAEKTAAKVEKKCEAAMLKELGVSELPADLKKAVGTVNKAVDQTMATTKETGNGLVKVLETTFTGLEKVVKGLLG